MQSQPGEGKLCEVITRQSVTLQQVTAVLGYLRINRTDCVGRASTPARRSPRPGVDARDYMIKFKPHSSAPPPSSLTQMRCNCKPRAQSSSFFQPREHNPN